MLAVVEDLLMLEVLADQGVKAAAELVQVILETERLDLVILAAVAAVAVVVRDGDCRFFRVLLYCEVLRVFLVCGDIYRYYYGILFFTMNFRVFGFGSVPDSAIDIADDEDDDTGDTPVFTSSWCSCVAIVSSSLESVSI